VKTRTPTRKLQTRRQAKKQFHSKKNKTIVVRKSLIQGVRKRSYGWNWAPSIRGGKKNVALSFNGQQV